AGGLARDGPRDRLVPGRDPRRGGGLRVRLRRGVPADDGFLVALGPRLLRRRTALRPAAAVPPRRRKAVRSYRGIDPSRWRPCPDRGAPDPDHAVQPDGLRLRRDARPP